MLPKAIVELNLCRDAEASGSLGTDLTRQVWVLQTLETTKTLGRYLARELPPNAVLLLSGPLGAGKTSLVQGLAKGLGVNEQITSPTFALAQHYPQGTAKLVHLDLYRLEHPPTADELFLQEEEEARASGALMAIEWPERLSLDLPEAWRIELRHQDQGRLAQLTSPRKAST